MRGTLKNMGQAGVTAYLETALIDPVMRQNLLGEEAAVDRLCSGAGAGTGEGGTGTLENITEPVAAGPSLVQPGEGYNLKEAATQISPMEGIQML